MFWIITFIIITIIILLYFSNIKTRREWTEKYFNFLVDKFGHEIKERIINSDPWLGQTQNEFIAMHGLPEHIETVEMKSKIKHILSYSTLNEKTKRTTINKFTFDNGELIKIEKKGSITKVWNASKQLNPFD